MRQPLTILLFTWLLFGLKANSQDVTVRALLDTNKGLIGDQFTLHLQVEKEVNQAKVLFPFFTDTLSGKIEIISKSKIDSSNQNGKQLLTQDLVLSVFDTGFFEIPALNFAVISDQRSDTLSSLPLYFEIQAVKTDSTIHDIKAIYKVPLSFRELSPYIIGTIGLALLIWLLISYFKHRKPKDVCEALRITVEPPEVVALRELNRLKEEKPWLKNEIKYFYSRMSEIIRIYIEGRYQKPALEQTTDEILASLKDLCETADFQSLKSLLRLADLVKFAKAIPDASESMEHIDAAEQFVMHTTHIAKTLTAENAGKEASVVQSDKTV